MDERYSIWIQNRAPVWHDGSQGRKHHRTHAQEGTVGYDKHVSPFIAVTTESSPNCRPVLSLCALEVVDMLGEGEVQMQAVRS